MKENVNKLMSEETLQKVLDIVQASLGETLQDVKELIKKALVDCSQVLLDNLTEMFSTIKNSLQVEN